MFKRILQSFRKPTKHYEQPEHAWRVWDSGDAIHCTFNDAKERIVRWETLNGIIITTNDEGPYLPDVFWHFIGADGKEVCFPQGALGEKQITERAMKLEGFDFEQFGKYVPCTDNAIFIVWKAPRK